MSKPTKDQTIAAIEDCIAHWKRAERRAHVYCDDGDFCGGNNCALCKLFSYDDDNTECSLCPLFISERAACGQHDSVFSLVQDCGHDKSFMIDALNRALAMVKEADDD